MKKKLLALLAISSLILMSCHKEKKEAPAPAEPDAIEVATTSFVAEKGEGTVEIPVSANAKLTVTIANDAQQWLYYSATKAMTNSTVVIGYHANPTAKQRTGNVTITAGTEKAVVAITQAAGDAIVELGATSQKVNPRGETISVSFTSNDEVNVTPSVTWIKAKEVKDGVQTLEVSINDSGAAREGEVVFSAASDANAKAVFTVTQKAANIDPNAISILAFGNTGTTAAMNYLYPVLKEMGYTSIRLGNLYIDDSDLEKHIASISDSTNVYKFNCIEDDAWVTKDTSAVSVLEPEDWDYIVIGQTVANAADESKYAAAADLVKAIRVSNPFTPIAWNMGWAPKNGAEQYEAISDAVATIIKPNSDISVIIPTGTAIQNLRTSHFEDNLTSSDNKNLSNNIGRPVAAYTWAATLTGKSIDALKYLPDDLTDDGKAARYQYESDYLPAIKEAVKAAVSAPLKVTESVNYAPYKSAVDMALLKAGMAALGYPESMLNNYVEMPVTMIHNAFYNSSAAQKSTIAADSPSTIMAGFSGSTGSTNRKFAATHVFPHDALPVGTLIVLVDNTLQYRPEGWNTLSTANDGKDGRPSRPGNVTANVTEVTDAWWGTFTYRAFNISKRDGTEMTDADWAKVHKGFAIMVPKTSIGDGLENYGDGSWKW